MQSPHRLLFVCLDTDHLNAQPRLSLKSFAKTPVIKGISRNPSDIGRESNKLCGIAVMMFDASKDTRGEEARKLVKLVTNALRG